MKRARADVLLVEHGLAPTRAKAQALIMAGAVRVSRPSAAVADTVVQKPGELLAHDATLTLAHDPIPYVSRGGVKLAGALDAFAAHGLDPRGVTAVDVGASTGGFTDCLLGRGAAKVYAVDVGYGQLAHRLRQDARVVVRERTNARHLVAGDFAEPIDLVVVDASFIGLGKLMPAIARVLRAGGALVALVKPQFEAGRKAVSQGRGVIRDPEVRAAAIDGAQTAIEAEGLVVVAAVDSTLAGPRGNIERFLYARK